MRDDLVTDSDIVRTGVAAAKLGVTRKTLLTWQRDGKVKYEFKTPGPRGQFRWSMTKLRAQLSTPPREVESHVDEGRPD